MQNSKQERCCQVCKTEHRSGFRLTVQGGRKVIVNANSKNNFFKNWGCQDQENQAGRRACVRSDIHFNERRHPGTDRSGKHAYAVACVGECRRRIRVTFHRWTIIALTLTGSLFAADSAWAGLGEMKPSVTQSVAKMVARRSASLRTGYSVHDTIFPDGSQTPEFVSMGGVIFAVRWNAQHKPNMADLLGSSYMEYDSMARKMTASGRLQRNFRHDGNDFVINSTSHLHVFSGLAYRVALMPPGLRPDQLE